MAAGSCELRHVLGPASPPSCRLSFRRRRRKGVPPQPCAHLGDRTDLRPFDSPVGTLSVLASPSWWVQATELAGLHPDPLDVVVDVLAQQSGLTPLPGSERRHNDVRSELAAVDQAVDRVDVEAKHLGHSGDGDPLISNGLHHLPMVASGTTMGTEKARSTAPLDEFTVDPRRWIRGAGSSSRSSCSSTQTLDAHGVVLRPVVGDQLVVVNTSMTCVAVQEVVINAAASWCPAATGRCPSALSVGPTPAQRRAVVALVWSHGASSSATWLARSRGVRCRPHEEDTDDHLADAGHSGIARR